MQESNAEANRLKVLSLIPNLLAHDDVRPSPQIPSRLTLAIGPLQRFSAGKVTSSRLITHANERPAPALARDTVRRSNLANSARVVIQTLLCAYSEKCAAISGGIQETRIVAF